VLVDVAGPVILNGIEDVVTRPDLGDRALFLTLDPIPDAARRPEQELWRDFETERPHIAGRLTGRRSSWFAALIGATNRATPADG
jgi:hypothetical protein